MQQENIISPSISKKSSLKSRSLNSGAWILGSHVSLQVFRFVANLVVSRLLVPEMFGVMAIANVFMFGIWLFSDLGLMHNVVQSNRGDNKSFLDTVWTTQIMRGGVIFLVGCLIALALWLAVHYGYIHQDNAYADPSLPAVMIALSLSSMLGSFESTKIAAASRNLNVKKVKILEFGTQLVGMLFMVFWAWHDRTVWAFVYGAFVSAILKTLLSHTYLDGINNSFHWNKEEFKAIFAYGKWVFVSSGVGFLFMTLDKMMLGGMMDPKAFGLYAIATLILGAFKEVFTKVFGGVLFPALSETYREHPENLKSLYYKYRVLSDSGLCFLAGFLFATAGLIFGVLYDERYQGAAAIFQILSIGLIGLRNELTQQVFMAVGKPKLMTSIMVTNLILLAIAMLLANHYLGLTGVLWVVSLSSFFVTPLIIKYKIDLHIYSFLKELIGLVFLPIGYALGWLIVYLFKTFGLS